MFDKPNSPPKKRPLVQHETNFHMHHVAERGHRHSQQPYKSRQL
ncbi:unnamed protein product, partial [Didymodactylos carnosus]